MGIPLRDLNYKMTGADWYAGTQVNELSFDCPKCGAPYRVSVYCRLNGPPEEGRGLWSWKLSNPNDGWSITLHASIRNPNHGRKKSCGWHGTVSGGIVTDA